MFTREPFANVVKHRLYTWSNKNSLHCTCNSLHYTCSSPHVCLCILLLSSWSKHTSTEECMLVMAHVHLHRGVHACLSWPTCTSAFSLTAHVYSWSAHTFVPLLKAVRGCMAHVHLCIFSYCPRVFLKRTYLLCPSALFCSPNFRSKSWTCEGMAHVNTYIMCVCEELHVYIHFCALN